MDRSNPRFLFAALIEKAYLKVRGGYDFPGSNSGTDLWILTSWIPEQIFLQNDETTATTQQLWRRILNAFQYGDVLFTMGTGKLTKREEKALGLAGEHDYAVLDMKEVNDRRLLLVKNPWSEAPLWKCRLSLEHFREELDQESPTKDIDKSLAYSLDQSLADMDDLTPGTFWTDFNSIFHTFESLYLNWNPGLFSHRQDVHFTWNLSKQSTSPNNFGSHPQYALINIGQSVTTVWLLLSRHFKTGDWRQPLSSKSKPGFISLYAFLAKPPGQRVFTSSFPVHRGTYVDSPNTLLRFELPASTTYTIAVSQQSLPERDHNFTLSTFSLAPTAITAATDRYSNVYRHSSRWTVETAGGNPSSRTYPENPQFSLSVSAPSSDLVILLEAEDPEVQVNARLVWSRGTRVFDLRSRDIVADTGEYQRGCAFAEAADVKTGQYTIVCSTFTEGVVGPFSLRVASTQACMMKLLPPEGSGRLKARLPTAKFGAGVGRLLAPISTTRMTRFFLIARHISPAGQRGPTRTPLKLSVELGQGPYKVVLISSASSKGEIALEEDGGGYSDAPAGVRTADLDINPGMAKSNEGLWLVVQRLGEQVEVNVEVEVLSEGRVEVGAWGIGDG